MTSFPARSVPASPIGTGSRRVGDVSLAEVEGLVLDEHHGVRIGYRAQQQTRYVDGTARHHDLETGDVGQPALEALRVLRRTAVPGPTLRPQHHRHGQLPTRHEVSLGGAVHELVECERDEVDEHDLENGPHP